MQLSTVLSTFNSCLFPSSRLLWCGARSTATRPTAPSWVRFLEASWGTSSSTWSRPTSSWKRFTRWASFRTTSSWMLWPIKWAFEGCCSNQYFSWQLRNGHFSIELNVFCIFTVVLKLFLIAFRPTRAPWSPSSWAILQTRQERFEIHLDGKKWPLHIEQIFQTSTCAIFVFILFTGLDSGMETLSCRLN